MARRSTEREKSRAPSAEEIARRWQRLVLEQALTVELVELRHAEQCVRFITDVEQLPETDARLRSYRCRLDGAYRRVRSAREALTAFKKAAPGTD